MTLTVEVVSPEAILFTGEANMIVARTLGGGDIGPTDPDRADTQKARRVT